MTSTEIKKAARKTRKPSGVTTKQLSKTALNKKRQAAGLAPVKRLPLTSKAKMGVMRKPAAAKTITAKAKNTQLQADVVKLWNSPAIKKLGDAAKMRKAIAEKLNLHGKVLGILRDAGIDGKKA